MSNFSLKLCLVGCFFLISRGGIAQELSQKSAYDHLKYLASDALQGRNTGTEGNNQAARYIADVFKKAGLKSAPGGENYFQNFVLRKSEPSLGNQLTVNGKKLKEKEEMIFLQGKDLDLSSEIVFVNYGYVDEASGRDDYAGLEVKDKIVIAYLGKDEKSDPNESFSLISKKRKDATKKGVAAFIELYNAPYPWQGITRFFTRSRFSPLSPEENQMGELAYIWINDKDDVFEGMLQAKTKMEGSIVSKKGASESIKTQNVVGIIEGSDPQMKEEFVVLSAHYDHVGTRKNRTNNPEADTIFNGARDNAMGTTAVLEAARYFSKNPPKRSMLLVAYTGEEIGLLGSRYFSEQPVIPLEKMAYNLNTDGAGYNDKSIVTVIGLSRTNAEDLIKEACEKAGLTAIDDPAPEQGLFDRSDNVNLAVQGIPAPTFSPGFTAFDSEIQKYYHRETDEAEAVDPAYLFKYVKAFIYSGENIANYMGDLLWKAGDKYEAAYQELHK